MNRPNAGAKTDDEGADSGLSPMFIPQPSTGLMNPSHPYFGSPAYNQAANFNPSMFTLYQGNPYPSPSFSPCFLGSSPLSPLYLNPPGLPQYASSPGFLTGAGFHFGHGSALGGLSPHGNGCSPVQAGLLLHAAAIVGDQQKILELLQDESINLECRDHWGRVALVYAVLGDYHEIVEILLSAGAKPDATDTHKCTPLHFATYKGNLASVKALLHASVGENQRGIWLAQDKRGVTPLHHAAHHSDHKCLQALLKYALPGTLDTGVDHRKRTPLHWAAAYGSDENVRLLIKHGANNLKPDQEGKTPLHWAAMSKAPGAKGCVKTLIYAAPSIINWQDYEGITALHLAVAESRLDAVDVILSVQKCDVDLTDNQFRTPLHWACSRGVTTIVGRLLDRGAHLGAVDLYGATPLHYAAQLNHADTVELLVRRPCVRDDPSKEGHTALFWAAAKNADLSITAMVRHGASVTKADPRGCTPLHIAAGAGHISTVGLLLRLRAPFDICTNDGCTPLLHAAQSGHAHIVKLLAKAGASLDHRDNEGQCALHHAVLSGHLYLAQILIKAGTSVDVQDYSGRTPLHMAAYRGLSDIMFLLLENRGDVNARDHEGQSALHWAAKQGHLGAVNTLLDFHAYPNYTQTSLDGYTPLDCAYIAEHLEIAQVLIEAGGLSITKIRDIAASKIQAMIRGYLSRKCFRKLQLGFKEESIEDIEAATVKSSTAESEIVGLCSSKADNEGTSNPILNLKAENGSPERKNIVNLDSKDSAEDSSEKVQNLMPASDVRFRKSGSHMKTVHYRRRQKVIANNIMLGARKKTVRELELPDLGELGIEEEVGNISDSSEREDDISMIEPRQSNVLPMGQALQYPRNIASILITASVGRSPETRENLEITDTCLNSKENKPISEKLNSLKEIHGNDMLVDSDIKKLNYIRRKRNCPSPSSDSSTLMKTMEDCDSCRSENLKTCHCKGEKEERRRLLEERFARSIEVAQKEDSVTSSKNTKMPTRQIMSARARKQAEEKWNNKLASLTLQVQRPSSEKTGTSFSYNLASPNRGHPSTKSARVESSGK